jgi:hypothetical protein
MAWARRTPPGVFRVAGNIPTGSGALGIMTVSYPMARLYVDDVGVAVGLWPPLVARLLTGSTEPSWTATWERIKELRISGKSMKAMVIAAPGQNCRVLAPLKSSEEIVGHFQRHGITVREVTSSFWENFRGSKTRRPSTAYLEAPAGRGPTTCREPCTVTRSIQSEPTAPVRRP